MIEWEVVPALRWQALEALLDAVRSWLGDHVSYTEVERAVIECDQHPLAVREAPRMERADGAALRALREAGGLTLREVASGRECSEGAVSAAEKRLRVSKAVRDAQADAILCILHDRLDMVGKLTGGGSLRAIRDASGLSLLEVALGRGVTAQSVAGAERRMRGSKRVRKAQTGAIVGVLQERLARVQELITSNPLWHRNDEIPMPPRRRGKRRATVEGAS